MTTDNIINLVSAIIVGCGTLALAFMAWKSIRENRKIHETEQRQRLLNEIIEWAINITKCPFEKDFRDIVGVTDATKVRLFTYNHIIEVKESFMGMSGRSQYISQIALKFEQHLQKSVQELTKDLEANIELFDEWQHAMADDLAMDISDYAEKAEAHGRQLDKSVNKVIEEATKIKTSDIGKKEENMSKEGEVTASNEPTIKDIEEHLRRQAKKGAYLTFAVAGSAIIIGGFSFLAKTVSVDTALWSYRLMLAVGLGMMVFAYYKIKKI